MVFGNLSVIGEGLRGIDAKSTNEKLAVIYSAALGEFGHLFTDVSKHSLEELF
jgi:hypothetical protein